MTGSSVAQESRKVNPSFSEDVAFMKKHTSIVTLTDGNAAVAIAPTYQERVMTSTVDRENGTGFGWINRKVIEAANSLKKCWSKRPVSREPCKI